MPKKTPKKRVHSRRSAPPKPDILDVHKVAALLTVGTDTVYELFKAGELPGRKVGRKWITTRSAVMRWVEHSLTTNATERAMHAAERAIQTGDKAALAKVLKSGAVRVKAG
jgi:excisionase family DNA binding protein